MFLKICLYLIAPVWGNGPIPWQNRQPPNVGNVGDAVGKQFTCIAHKIRSLSYNGEYK